MNGFDRRSQRAATLSILGVVAIPFASVSIAALMAGPISTTDPVRMSTGLLSAVAGSVIGLSVLKFLRSALLVVGTAAEVAVDWIESASEIHVLQTTTSLVVIAPARPISAVPASSVGRRGPPSGL